MQTVFQGTSNDEAEQSQANNTNRMCSAHKESSYQIPSCVKDRNASGIMRYCHYRMIFIGMVLNQHQLICASYLQSYSSFYYRKIRQLMQLAFLKRYCSKAGNVGCSAWQTLFCRGRTLQCNRKTNMLGVVEDQPKPLSTPSKDE